MESTMGLRDRDSLRTGSRNVLSIPLAVCPTTPMSLSGSPWLHTHASVRASHICCPKPLSAAGVRDRPLPEVEVEITGQRLPAVGSGASSSLLGWVHGAVGPSPAQRERELETAHARSP